MIYVLFDTLIHVYQFYKCKLCFENVLDSIEIKHMKESTKFADN